MKQPRIGLVGAGRRRQGLGPFVARDLVRAGARIPAFVTTTSATRDAAAQLLAATCGTHARGYLDVETMLARESLDALAILSPALTHAPILDAALAAGLHVLCEKPLVWGAVDLADSTARCVSGFEGAELLLWENCQWPYTLAAYSELFPGARDRPPRHFAMSLQPSGGGAQGIGDSLPHALSLLQALVPGARPRLADIRFDRPDPTRREEIASFRYHTDEWELPVEVYLSPTDASPREAAYALDGRRATRRVASADYRLSFASDDGRTVPLADPLTRLVADFVAALGGRQRPEPAPGRAIAERGALLGQLVKAYGASQAAGG